MIYEQPIYEGDIVIVSLSDRPKQFGRVDRVNRKTYTVAVRELYGFGTLQAFYVPKNNVRKSLEQNIAI